MRSRVHDPHLLPRNGLLLTVLYRSVQSGCGARTWLVGDFLCADGFRTSDPATPGKVTGER